MSYRMIDIRSFPSMDGEGIVLEIAKYKGRYVVRDIARGKRYDIVVGRYASLEEAYEGMLEYAHLEVSRGR